MKNKHELNVIEAYRTYQCSRSDANTGEQFQSEKKKQINQDEVSSGDSESNQDYQKVITFFRFYQTGRDPYRDEIVARVMATVTENSPLDHPAVNTSLKNESPRRKWAVIQKLDELLLANLSVLLGYIRPYRLQVALSFMAIFLLTTVVTFLFQEQHQGDFKISAANFPSELLENSHDLAVTINQVYDPTLGFSSNQDANHLAFRMGVIAVDLPVLASADQRDTLIGMVGEVRRLTQLTTSNTLLQSLRILQNTLEKTADANAISAVTMKFTHDMEEYFILQRQQYVVFELGKWIELTLLTSQLSDGKQVHLLTKLLRKGGTISNQALNALQHVPGVAVLINDLQIIVLSDTATMQNMRKLQNKLQQIKAAL